jgi:hypothetical protein
MAHHYVPVIESVIELSSGRLLLTMNYATDPVAVVIEYGHRAGLEVFLSMRVNDTHDSRLPGRLENPLMSPVKRQNPDWLLKGSG